VGLEHDYEHEYEKDRESVDRAWDERCDEWPPADPAVVNLASHRPEVSMRRVLIVGLSLVLAAAAPRAQSPSPSPATAAKPQKSLDLSALDRSVDPCANFYQFACGGWRKANPIPGDKARWGRFDQLSEFNQYTLRDILEQASISSASRTPLEAKVGDMYASCMDQSTIDARGLTPIDADLAAIDAAASKPELARALGTLKASGLSGPFAFAVGADLRDSTKTLVNVDQGGITLPDRDYYLKADAKNVETREAYRSYTASMLELAGETKEQATARAAAILAFETKLAAAQLDRTARRDPRKRDNRNTRTGLSALAPGFDFEAYFAAASSPAFTELNVGWPDFFRQFDVAWQQASMDDLKAWARWRVLNGAAPALAQRFEKAHFGFFSGYLRGIREQPPRWKTCASAVDGALGEALGQLYVARAFGPEAKTRMKALVAALTTALEQDIRALEWMTPETKTRALEKLRKLGKSKIGYPDAWRDYSSVAVARDDYAGNLRRASIFEVKRNFAKLGKPVDKTEWSMTPPTVNAYYSSQFAEIVFPAGILQPPFFDASIDDAVNFGAIGAVIGHELTHGFDDSGRKFDGDGNLTDWWTDADGKAFDQRAACIADQYSGYTPVNDPKTGKPAFLQGKLTLGENIGDNGGVRVAYMALQNTLKGTNAKAIDGFTPDQRFFLGFAQVWCQNTTDAESLQRILTDPHSPGVFRTNGTVANMPEFEKAFSCTPGAPMAPVKRCRVW
jgi:predicted metalloendopeptidase